MKKKKTFTIRCYVHYVWPDQEMHFHVNPFVTFSLLFHHNHWIVNHKQTKKYIYI